MEKAIDYLLQLQIRPKLLREIAELDEFKGLWRALGNLAPERLSALRRVATIESVGSSTRIEGSRLSDEDVDKLLSGLDPRSFRSRDEQEVAGYAELMELLFESWQHVDLTENHIKQLHGVLLRHSEKDAWHRGEYKKLPNSVEAFDETGRSLGVIFETASSFDTPRLMEDLVRWTLKGSGQRQHHPILVIAVFIVRFLAIHPFQDGNGRLARALSMLLLLRSGYEYVPYSSLERVIEENKDSYYRALRRAQSTLDKDESRLGDWLEFFVECLLQQKNVLLRKLERERLMAPLPALSENLLRIVQEHGRVTVHQAVTLTGANRNTVKVHLRHLVEAGKLAQRGRGRGTWYDRP